MPHHPEFVYLEENKFDHYYDYLRSREIAQQDYPFYALIMAALRQADTDNFEKLKMIFPNISEEFQARYNAPAGALTPEEMDAFRRYSENAH